MKFLILIIAFATSLVDAHGFLKHPPARSSAWRYDPRFTKPYYQDMEMFCGGVNVQWQQNGGKCSICGESYSAKEKMFEKGGSHYTGNIVAAYRKGHTLWVELDIWTYHLGWFEFRICKVDGWSTDATQECLDKTLLADENGKTRFSAAGKGEGDSFQWMWKLVLPAGLSCDHCVLQWKYNAGNRHGTDPVTEEFCYGCGPGQEQFYGCADVSILDF